MPHLRVATPILLALLGAAAPPAPLGAQARPLLSPPDSTELVVEGKRMVVRYSRPSMRGREIMGGLVPWNRVWRTGANLATHFTTEIDLRFGDIRVPAGRYTLYTVPNPTVWNLVINRETGQWGTRYDHRQDLARIPVKPASTAATVDTLTIALAPIPNGGAIVLQWENTQITVPFEVAP